MIKFNYIIIFIVLMNHIDSFSQEKKPDRVAFETYESELQLSEQQSEQFIKTLTKYNFDQGSKKIDLQGHNRNVKSRDLEIQKLLTSDQFKRYILLKNDLEPEATYKFQ